jgi:hypothetical protein
VKSIALLTVIGDTPLSEQTRSGLKMTTAGVGRWARTMVISS